MSILEDTRQSRTTFIFARIVLEGCGDELKGGGDLNLFKAISSGCGRHIAGEIRECRVVNSDGRRHKGTRTTIVNCVVLIGMLLLHQRRREGLVRRVTALVGFIDYTLADCEIISCD